MLTEIVVLFARRTFGGTAHVTRFDLVGSEESVTVFAFAYGTANTFDFFRRISSRSVGGGIHVMIAHALFSKEGAVTSGALVTRDLSWSKVHASRLFASVTFLAFTRVMRVIVVLVTGFTIDAKVNTTQEPRQGITSVVMLSHFDENDVFISGRSFEDDLIIVIQGQHDDLVLGEMFLKGVDFG